MAIFCLPKKDADAFREALKAGKVDLDRLVNMTSDQRRAELGTFVGEDNAKDVNTLFESKLLLKNQQQGIINWAKTVAGMKPEVRRDIVSRVEKMDTILGAGGDERAFLKDLAEQKLGIGISYEQAQKITDLTGKLKELAQPYNPRTGEAQRDQFGNYSVPYFEQLRKTKEYIQSLTPSGMLERAAATFRNSMLSAPHIPIKVTAETTLNRGIEEAVKTIVYRGKGANSDLAYDYTKRAREIYSKTGYNLASMNSLDEGNMFGDPFTHFEGPGKLRAAQKGLDRLVIHYGHGLLFNAHYNGTFASSVNAEATRIAKAEGLSGEELKTRSADLMKQAMQVGVKEPLPAQIRAKAQEDAMRVTNTNDTYGSRLGKFMKGTLNKVAPPLHLGDLTIAFSKIPGNLIANSVEVAGGGILKGAYQFKKALADAKENGTKPNLIPAVTTMTRMVGGLAVASLIGSQITKENYDEKKKMIRVGGYWISTELLGPIGPAVNGFLQAKFAPPENSKVAAYMKGALAGIPELPGIKEVIELGTGMKEKGFVGGVEDFGANFVKGRVPGLFKDAYQSYTAGSALPAIAGTKVQSDEQKQAAKTSGAGISPGAQDTQLRGAKIKDLMDKIEAAKAKGQATDQMESDLRDKLDRRTNTDAGLAQKDADRANKLLGLTGDDAYQGTPQEDDEHTPDFSGKYGKNAKGYIEKLTTWAQAMGTDPIDAFKKLAAGENIERLEDGTIIVERMPKKGPGGSTAIRRKLGGGKAVKLDHTVPLEIGGTNDPSNLRLVTTAEHGSYSPMENYLGQALHAGRITGPEARKLITGWKAGVVPTKTITDRVGTPYNGGDAVIER